MLSLGSNWFLNLSIWLCDLSIVFLIYEFFELLDLIEFLEVLDKFDRTDLQSSSKSLFIWSNACVLQVLCDVWELAVIGLDLGADKGLLDVTVDMGLELGLDAIRISVGF